MELRDKITHAVEFIRTHTEFTAKTGIILGTGLGDLVKELNTNCTISYSDIPHFPVSTVEFHAGELIFGTLHHCPVIVMRGRFHYYEGYTQQEITFPVRVLKALGVKKLIITNACGGINSDLKPGDIMIIRDHINLLGDNPLVGKNDPTLGPRFPDMSQPYNHTLCNIAEVTAQKMDLDIRAGVYAALSGPNLETAAEYKFLRIIGADAVGMSTVPETIVAVHSGMKVLGLSIITDECVPETLRPVNVQKIIRVAKEAEPKLTELIRNIVKQLEKNRGAGGESENG